MGKQYKEYIKENEKLSKQLAEKENECAKNGMSWDDMFKETLDIRIKITENDRQARLIQSPTMTFGKKWAGDLMSIERFIEDSKKETITDNDGYGKYATETGVSDIYIYPSDILEDKYRTDFSHVIWFNKVKEEYNI